MFENPDEVSGQGERLWTEAEWARGRALVTSQARRGKALGRRGVTCPREQPEG